MIKIKFKEFNHKTNQWEDRELQVIQLHLEVEDSGLQIGYDAEYTGGFTVNAYTVKR